MRYFEVATRYLDVTKGTWIIKQCILSPATHSNIQVPVKLPLADTFLPRQGSDTLWRSGKKKKSEKIIERKRQISTRIRSSFLAMLLSPLPPYKLQVSPKQSFRTSPPPC